MFSQFVLFCFCFLTPILSTATGLLLLMLFFSLKGILDSYGAYCKYKYFHIYLIIYEYKVLNANSLGKKKTPSLIVE